jgi:hypothetical protein
MLLLQSKSSLSKRSRRLAQLFVQLNERFLELPVRSVIASLWLMGVALIGLGVLVLYLLWSSLLTVAGM